MRTTHSRTAASNPRSSRSWSAPRRPGASRVNDVLLAILLQVLEPLAGERAPTQRRRELAVASIVNLRRDFGLDPNTAFGQFLSSFRLSHPMPPGISLHDLARDVNAATRRVKSSKLYLQTLLAMAASGVRWRFLSRDDRVRVLRQELSGVGRAHDARRGRAVGARRRARAASRVFARGVHRSARAAGRRRHHGRRRPARRHLVPDRRVRPGVRG